MAEQRIQKVLSDQGVCSRRAAEKLIDEGRVKVNGHPVTLGDKMDPDFDKVSIDGKSVRIVRKRQYTYLMLNKPRGYITTASNAAARPLWICSPAWTAVCIPSAVWIKTAKACCC